MSLRRSSRLKVKEEKKASEGTPIQKQQVYWNASSSSDAEGGVEQLIAVVNTPSRSRITPQKLNNFTKV